MTDVRDDIGPVGCGGRLRCQDGQSECHEESVHMSFLLSDEAFKEVSPEQSPVFTVQSTLYLEAR